MKLNGKFQTDGEDDLIGFYFYDKEVIKFQRFAGSTFRENYNCFKILIFKTIHIAIFLICARLNAL
jgi:hypothetical protein